MQVKLFWIQAPMRDKGFVARDSGGNGVEFEKKVNEWLVQNSDCEIHHIKQSACGGSFGPALWLISVWYTRHGGA
ncbi:hypothetical protein ACTJIL_09610 [Luteimonas sp. 22616]|uniref:hypothetical protein n=1 Tax=Luteimonas sp. 22616 TaxID=3453951 RepID=UPI003F868285